MQLLISLKIYFKGVSTMLELEEKAKLVSNVLSSNNESMNSLKERYATARNKVLGKNLSFSELYSNIRELDCVTTDYIKSLEQELLNLQEIVEDLWNGSEHGNADLMRDLLESFM